MAVDWVASIRSRMARAASNQDAIPGSAHHAAVHGDRFPAAALHRNVGGVDHTVHDVAVDEGLSWYGLAGKAVHEVTHLLLVAVHASLVWNREHPTGLGVCLLHEIAGALLDECSDARRAGIGDHAAFCAVDFVAELHAA